MRDTLLFIGLAAALVVPVAAKLVVSHRRLRRRTRLQRTPLDRPSRALLERRVPLYRALPAALRARLDADLQIFLAEKAFYGCDGLEVDAEMRLIIAAQACLLQLNLACKYYPTFTSILIYPDSYVAIDEEHDGDIVTTRRHVRSGESWHRGPVVLSWADVEFGLKNPGDGCNVVLHEFAHKLDEQAGAVDGAPPLPHDRIDDWAALFGREYARLRHRADHHRHTVMDDYGADSPPEFFAVAVETFFEKPQQLRRDSPQLYEALRGYFGLDPASWTRAL